MAHFHVTVFYRTKRGGVACGMDVTADTEDDAVEFAEQTIIGKSRARKVVAIETKRLTPARKAVGGHV